MNLSAGEHYMQVSKWLGHSTFVLTLTTSADYINEDEQVAPKVGRGVVDTKNVVELQRRNAGPAQGCYRSSYVCDEIVNPCSCGVPMFAVQVNSSGFVAVHSILRIWMVAPTGKGGTKSTIRVSRTAK